MSLETAREICQSFDKTSKSFWHGEMSYDDIRASLQALMLIELVEEVHLLRLDLFKLNEHNNEVRGYNKTVK